MVKSFTVRTLSAAIGILFLYFVISKGAITFLGFIVLMNIIANWELFKAFKEAGIEINLISSALLGTFLLTTVHFFTDTKIFFLPFFVIIVIEFLSSMMNYKRNKLENIVFTIFSFIYTSIPLTYIILLRKLPFGIAFLWWVFITTWSCDTFAYITGMLAGNHKLAPIISPNKSIEGSIGGILGSVVASSLFAMLTLPQVLFWDSVMVGLLIGVFSQIGDLSASLIKRFCGIKDFSNLIPGHGGVLDRFDSTLFSFPIAYYYIVTAIQKGGLL
ncbi:MAG: phosphatidate cytidylyltransferase [Thermosediminibacteraceae bacterium]|nr:phosphatidate cytidylyltransferase [Thermosediminibacteraceae bacterium]